MNLIYLESFMENFEVNKNTEMDEVNKVNEEFFVIQNTGEDLDDLRESLEDTLEVKAIVDSLKKLNSFSDLPLNIIYEPESKAKIDKKEFPQKLDIWPKPVKGGRKTIGWKTISDPPNLTICLDDKVFTLEPDAGSIKAISVNKWNVVLTLKVLFTVNLTYEPKRLTKNLVKMWKGKPLPKNGKQPELGQIFWFSGSKVNRIK